MEYGQIVLLLFIALVFYYGVLIVMDIRKAKAALLAEQENGAEEEFDISDEAQQFQPIEVSRNENNAKLPIGVDLPMTEVLPAAETVSEVGDAADGTTKEMLHPNYREVIVMDGILVENLMEEVNKLAETGSSDLGAIIYSCEQAR